MFEMTDLVGAALMAAFTVFALTGMVVITKISARFPDGAE